MALQRRHNECDGISNHQRLDGLLNCLFRQRSKKSSKLHLTGLCEQSGTKPNLVAKILATNFGVFFCNIYNVFKKYVQCGSNNTVIKYCGWGIPPNWDISFGKLGRATNFGSFCRKLTCNAHGWPSAQPGACTQPCPIVDTAVPPLFTQPCHGRKMSTAVCIYVAGLCASCPAV